MSTESLVKAVVATAELMGTELTIDGARMFCADLADYPEPMVLNALRKCRREVTGRLTLAAVVSRLDDGRPGADEAWAMIPRDEYRSVVWTDEMATAYGVAAPLLAEGDQVAARMAFREAYQAAVSRARDANRQPTWRPSLGWDPAGREAVLRDAVEKGRLPGPQAITALPHGRFTEGAPEAPEFAKRLAAKFSGR